MTVSWSPISPTKITSGSNPPKMIDKLANVNPIFSFTSLDLAKKFDILLGLQW